MKHQSQEEPSTAPSNQSGKQPKPTKKRTTKKTYGSTDLVATSEPFSTTSLTEGASETFGLGDAIEVVTKKTGIKKVVEVFSELTGIDCGCDKRKEAFNRIPLFKYNKPECLTKDQYESLTPIIQTITQTNTITVANQKVLWGIYTTNFPMRKYKVIPSCHKCWHDIYNHIKLLHESYPTPNS